MRSTFTLCSLLTLVHATRVETESLTGLEANINANPLGYGQSGEEYGAAMPQIEMPETECPCSKKKN